MIRIEHDHGGGTVVHGTTRGDGTNHIVKATGDGWRFSRNVGTSGAWYLPRSRDRRPDTARIERLAAALREAGHQVQVHLDDTPRATADVEADRTERTAGRVQRYTELADARHESGAARLAAVDEARQRIPLGQPILSARDASYRAGLHQREEAARAELAVGEHWHRRAHAAGSTQRYRHNPRVTLRRVNKLEADRRGWQRRLDRARSDHTSPGNAERRAADIIRAEEEIARLDERLFHWRSELAAQRAAGIWAPWEPQHFRIGDEVLILNTWYPVLRVNKKSVTVPPLVLLGERRLDERGKDTWTDTASYDKVYGRRRDGNILRTPPPTEDVVCTEYIVIRTFNEEFIPERDGGPCTGTPVAHLTVYHDGVSCGCHGLCRYEKWPDGISRDIDPWAEVRLLCADHDHEYQTEARERDESWPPPGGTYERLP